MRPESDIDRVGWAALIGAAAPIIRSEGLAKLDLDRLAADLDASPAAVRYWFQEPGEVLISLMQMRQNWFLEEARKRSAGLSSHAERLWVLIDLAATDYDSAYWFELWKLCIRDESAKRARQEITDEYRRTVAGIIRAGQRTGEFGAASPDKAALVITSLLCGYADQITLGDDLVSRETMTASLASACKAILEADLSPPS